MPKPPEPGFSRVHATCLAHRQVFLRGVKLYTSHTVVYIDRNLLDEVEQVGQYSTLRPHAGVECNLQVEVA